MRDCITREDIIAAIDTYEVIEAYPDDKYLPSYLILASKDGDTLHILFATDVDGSNVRIVTGYRPDPLFWDVDFKNGITP